MGASQEHGTSNARIGSKGLRDWTLTGEFFLKVFFSFIGEGDRTLFGNSVRFQDLVDLSSESAVWPP